MTEFVDTTEDGLMSAICQQPAEDTPRLVYADWLEENDQPERAEFIRVQIKRHQVGVGQGYKMMPSPRETELFALHAGKWRPEVLCEKWQQIRNNGEIMREDYQVSIDQWTRGFPSHVSCTTEWFMGGWDRPRVDVGRCTKCKGSGMQRDSGPYVGRYDRVACSTCSGTGRRTRSDGNAARLALAVPLEAVRLTDKVPWTENGAINFWWLKEGYDDHPPQSVLPAVLWEGWHNEEDWSLEAAQEALAKRCVQFAMEEACILS